jgi:hypothetical protein
MEPAATFDILRISVVIRDLMILRFTLWECRKARLYRASPDEAEPCP